MVSVPQSLNRYSYCLNNPLNLVDPTGEWSLWNAVKDNWKTIAVVAICVAATVLLPGAGGFIAGAVISAVVQGSVELGATFMETGDMNAALVAGGKGLVEGFATGLLGGGVGKVASVGLKSLAASSARTVLGDALAKVGSSMRGVGKTIPGLGGAIERREMAAAFGSLDDIARTGLPVT